MSEALIYEARKNFHIKMLETNTLTMTEDGTASNADMSSASSKAIAKRMTEIISNECGQKINVMNKISGQTLGRQFEVIISEFLGDTFLKLNDIRPGKWLIQRSGFGTKTSDFAQYEYIVNDKSALAADIRKSNGGKPILHASISAKYTMRSDRAQNSRTQSAEISTLIDGKRLKDISDLPLDLAV